MGLSSAELEIYFKQFYQVEGTGTRFKTPRSSSSSTSSSKSKKARSSATNINEQLEVGSRERNAIATTSNLKNETVDWGGDNYGAAGSLPPPPYGH